MRRVPLRAARLAGHPAAMLFCALLLAAAPGSLVAQSPGMGELRSEHVLLAAPRGGDCARILSELERAYREVRRFGLTVPPTVRTVCYATTADYIRGSGGSGYQLAMARQGVIHLQPYALLLRRGGFARAIVHEMAHVALTPAAAAGLPRWLNEGLAMSVAGEKAPESMKVRTLAELERVLERPGSWARARSAYGTSERLVGRLIGAIGRSGVIDLARRVAAGEGFEGAFRRLVKVDPAAWGRRELVR